MKTFPPHSLAVAVRQWLNDWKVLRRKIAREAVKILKRLMVSQSLRSVAKAVGLSPTYLSLVLNGGDISPEAFLKLAEYELKEGGTKR